MSIVVEERPNSPRVSGGTSPSAEILCFVIGTDLEALARTALLTFVPAAYHLDGANGGLLLPYMNHRLDYDAGAQMWDAAVVYGWQNQAELSFDTTGGTAHIAQSLRTVGSVAAGGGTAPDYHGAIGVNEDGSVQGVDVVVPTYTWYETYYLADAFCTPEYRRLIRNLTGRVNSAVFKGMAAGEVLFLGARGNKRGYLEDWQVTYGFGGRLNESNLVVARNQAGTAVLTIPEKKGWNYVWCRYRTEEDSSAHILVTRPLSAHVEQVCPEADLNLLMI